jgi:enoyl-CoA hydratase/carnithine racemase
MSYSLVALSPDGGASWALGRSLPRALASELLMSGDRISAPRLYELGVINRVCGAGNALSEALGLAAKLNTRAPNVIASIKDLLNEVPNQTLSQQLASERDHFVKNLHHDNAAEGINAFLQKRPAEFR